MTRYLGLGVLLFLVWSPPPRCLADPEPNYCHDTQRLQTWKDLLAKYPDDPDLQALHAVWVALCLQVTLHALPLDEAMARFEKAQTRLAEQRKKP